MTLTPALWQALADALNAFDDAEDVPCVGTAYAAIEAARAVLEAHDQDETDFLRTLSERVVR